MDSGDKFEPEKRDGDSSGFHSSEWRFSGANLANSSMGLIPVGNPNALCKGDAIGSSSCSSASAAVDLYCTIPWDNPQTLGLCGLNVQTNATTLNTLGFRKGVPGTTRAAAIDNLGWDPPISSMLKGGMPLPIVPGILPQSLSQFPADSAFIERAARFSCFNVGNVRDMVNQLGCHESMIPYSSGGGMIQEVFVADALKMVHVGQSQSNELNVAETPKRVSLSVEHQGIEGSPLKNEGKNEGFTRAHDEAKGGVNMSVRGSDEPEFSDCVGQEETSMLDCTVGEPSLKGIGSKKRKRSCQDVEVNQAMGGRPQTSEPAKGGNENQQKGDQNPTSISNKSVGKHTSEPPKEEYIHVRARRGQATNSHSLAERVRREQISERTKFLQDLVPGCSKVTGKVVMLDEIINYVQSLQRQVEFLSMKLATVNPRLGLNIEGLLAKYSQAGPSSLGFSPDVAITYAQSHTSQPGLMQGGLPGLGNPSDALRRTMTNQLTATNGGFREPTQLSNVWEDELHNVVQMSFDTSVPSNSQDVYVSLPPWGRMKVEL